MAIASFSFLGFALLVVLSYNIFANRTWRLSVLFLANIAFLLTYSRSPTALLPLLLFVIYGFLAVRIMQRPHSKSIYIAIVAATILAFIWLKKIYFPPTFVFSDICVSHVRAVIHILQSDAPNHRFASGEHRRGDWNCFLSQLHVEFHNSSIRTNPKLSRFHQSTSFGRTTPN